MSNYNCLTMMILRKCRANYEELTSLINNGVKLAELYLDDAAIAHLLGHRGMNCVYRYRRASIQHLKEETKKCREAIDEILGDITKAWA